MKLIDELTKQDFCRILCASAYTYEQTPSQMYAIWEDFKNHIQREYPWDVYKYEGQKEAAQYMCRFIHRLYASRAGINVKQLEIEWKF